MSIAHPLKQVLIAIAILALFQQLDILFHRSFLSTLSLSTHQSIRHLGYSRVVIFSVEFAYNNTQHHLRHFWSSLVASI